MLTIFNRKELIVTFSMERQAQIRKMLSINEIDYTISIVNRNSPSTFINTRMRTGQNALGYVYIIYVHKDDYELATAIINGTYKK